MILLARAGGKLGVIILAGMLLAMVGYAVAPPQLWSRPPFATILGVRAEVSPLHLADGDAWRVDLKIERIRDPDAPCTIIDELTTIMSKDGQIRGSSRFRRETLYPATAPVVETRALFDDAVMRAGASYHLILEARCITAEGMVWGPLVLTPVIEIIAPEINAPGPAAE